MTTENQAPDPAQLPKGWRLQTVSDGDIRMYSPTGSTWLLRANTNEDFYDFIHGFLSDLMAAIPAPEGAQADMLLVPRELIKDAVESVDDYRCSLEFGSHDRKLLGRLKAALAAPRVTEGAQALTETQIERAWRLGFRHACDAERLNSDEEWGYKRANVIEEVQALAAPAPQDSLDSAQSSKGVAMQAPQAPAWQPIETAPKERGGLVDIICNERRYTGCHYDRICDEYRHITACGVLIRLKGATHWMPIPAAPQTKEPTNDR